MISNLALNLSQTGYVTYDTALLPTDIPHNSPMQSELKEFDPFALRPIEGEETLPLADQQVVLYVTTTRKMSTGSSVLLKSGETSPSLEGTRDLLFTVEM